MATLAEIFSRVLELDPTVSKRGNASLSRTARRGAGQSKFINEFLTAMRPN